MERFYYIENENTTKEEMLETLAQTYAEWIMGVDETLHESYIAYDCDEAGIDEKDVVTRANEIIKENKEKGIWW